MPTGQYDDEESQDSLLESNVPVYPQTFPSVMSSSASMVAANGRTSSPRPKSPITKPGRLSSSQPSSAVTNSASNRGAGGRISDALASLGARTRTLSSVSNSRNSSSTRERNPDETGESSTFGLDADPFASHINESGSSTLDTQSETHSKPSNSMNNAGVKKQRGSLLVAASDALGFGRGLGASLGKRMSKRNSVDQPISIASQSQQRFGLPWKRRPKVKGQWALQPQALSNVISDVIEISAAAGGISIRDSEEEIERMERERLREAAAESIGISPLMREDSSSRLTGNDSRILDNESFAADGSREDVRESFEDNAAESVRAMDRSRTSVNGTSKPNGLSSALQLQSLQTRESRHHRSSSVSATMSPSSPISVTRSISTLGQHGASTAVGGRITKLSNGSVSVTQTYPPDFPCLRNALDSYVKKSSTLFKHFPPSPLLKLGFSRQWRARLIVMTCSHHPGSAAMNGHRPFTPAIRQPFVCHLHLFKSSATEEKELERLEINEDSVVCVAEEEIAGRKAVVKVGGVDVGGRKKELNVKENGRTMWFLSVVDANESQDWIALLKSAVLEQRAERAGIGMSTFPSTTSGPRGDLDVMLSLRARDIATSVRDHSGSSDLNTHSRTSSSNAIQDLAKRRTVDGSSPAPTLRTYVGDTRPISPTVKMMSLKSLFSVPGRARSPSRATIRTEGGADNAPDTASLTARSNTLMNMLHSTDASSSGPSAPDAADVATTHVTQQPSPTIAGPILPVGPIISAADMSLGKVASTPPERELPDWYTLQNRPHHRGDSSSSINLGPSLLPPPRRRPWTSSGLPPARQEQIMEQGSHSRKSYQDSVSGGEGRLSVENDRTRPHSPADSLGTATGAFGTPDSRPRRASLSSSVSSFTPSPADRDQLNSRTNSGSQRRVRMGGKLPKMLAPPAGPPPSVPVTQSESINSTISLPAMTNRPTHPFVGERPPSRTSVRSANTSEARHGAVTSIGRRLSSSSAFSASSAGATTARLNNALAARQFPASTHPKRASMPPPRPAPTFALPPTPDSSPAQPETGRSSPMKSFRESFTQRSLRFSLSPPQAKSLSSRHDEPSVNGGHRRSLSNGSIGSKSSILNSATHISVGPRAPPPTGPLPPTPREQHSMSRNTSLRERLRMKSAPSSPSSALRGAASPPPSFPGSPPLVTVSSVSSLKDARHPVPIGEPITTIPHDINFLNMSPTDMSPTTANEDMNFLNLSSPLTTTHTPIPPIDSSSSMLFSETDDSPSNSGIVTALPAPPRRSRIITSTYSREKEGNPAPFTNPRTSAVVDDLPPDYVSAPSIDAFTP